MSTIASDYDRMQMNTPSSSRHSCGQTIYALIILVSFIVWVAIVSIEIGKFLHEVDQTNEVPVHPFDLPTETFSPSQPITGNTSSALEEIKSIGSPVGEQIIEQKVNVAPEDGARLHISLLRPVYQDPIGEQIKVWSISGYLAEIRSKTHWHEYSEKDAIYIERLAHVVPPNQLPAIIMQNATGKVLYVASGPQIPLTDPQLVSELRQAASQYQASRIANQQSPTNVGGQSSGSPYCPPDQRCPQPQPRFPNTPYPNQPQPSPTIDPPVKPNRLPWVQPVLPNRPVIAPVVAPVLNGLQGIKQLIYVSMGFIVIVVLLGVIGIAYFSRIQRPW